jgi:hypothetical protein
MGVNSEKLEALPLVGESKQIMSRWIPLRLDSGRGIRSLDGGVSPVRFKDWGSSRDAVKVRWM